ncbi:PilZ domain-containing protein [Geobacter sp. FeAm09]|uniref:PilZ domain-containing protein n=1 Tax=Geobacter sp. FeAm09 TaxID=2597769 RepID=UPI0011F076CE|nr:PilZ domain-containing protein [Geobacter sp. FeAm09]QEM68870.1 PilZ domain-containing protein [Geobacter sp. FeAm09]
MENRNFTRVDFSDGASISYNNHLVWGTVENLSLQGFYIRTSRSMKPDMPLNLPLDVTIYHPPHSSINVRASTVHCEETGVGMKIDELDADSFVRLVDAISLKSAAPGSIMHETYKVASCVKIVNV